MCSKIYMCICIYTFLNMLQLYFTQAPESACRNWWHVTWAVATVLAPHHVRSCRCTRVFVCMNIYVYACLCVCECVCVCVCIYVYVYIYTQMYTHMRRYVLIYVYIQTHVCMCVYTYSSETSDHAFLDAYVHVLHTYRIYHTHTHIQVYICMYRYRYT